MFGHNHADLQSVTPALAHDPSVNYSTARHPKRRGFKFEKILRKGCDRFEKKTSGLRYCSCCGPAMIEVEAKESVGPARVVFRCYDLDGQKPAK